METTCSHDPDAAKNLYMTDLEQLKAQEAVKPMTNDVSELLAILKALQREVGAAIGVVESGIPMVQIPDEPCHILEVGDFKITPRFGTEFKHYT